ncbi:MAG: hypothetical protein RID91_11220 [Azospirillaceae bacterium]
MIDLTQFLGTTSTKGNPLEYEIDGVVMKNSSAVFEEVQPHKLVLKGKFVLPFLGHDIPIDGELEALSESGDTVTLGYSLSGGKFMEQNYSATVMGDTLELTLKTSMVHKASLEGDEHRLAMLLLGIEQASIQPVASPLAGATNTKLSATAQVLGITIATTLVPKQH